MKYAVWFVRLIFAAWMIPAGLNHFLPLFPQPMGTQPLSMELIIALLDSRLFDLVKFVELIAGIGVLFAFFTPLSLLVCLPVSFGVFYWDAPLEGWSSGASTFGYATLLCNALLCLAYNKYYRPMFSVKTEVSERKQLVMGARIALGVLLVGYAANTLFLGSAPSGSQPLSDLLMTSLTNSRLLHVALVVQLIAGVLLLANILVPLALCAQMMISANALFWSLFLDQSPLGALLALVVFALNGLLMIAYLTYYRDILQRHTLAAGEEPGPANYDALMVNNDGMTGKRHYIEAVVAVLAAWAFYAYNVPGGSGIFSAFVLMYPLFTVLIRRFRDMGQHSWLLFIPVTLMMMYFDIKLGYFSFSHNVSGASFSESVDGLFNWFALIVTAGFLVWGAVGNSKSPGTN
jgi:putative oxidoreductase